MEKNQKLCAVSLSTGYLFWMCFKTGIDFSVEGQLSNLILILWNDILSKLPAASTNYVAIILMICLLLGMSAYLFCWSVKYYPYSFLVGAGLGIYVSWMGS
jgi:hypothetical protein